MTPKRSHRLEEPPLASPSLAEPDTVYDDDVMEEDTEEEDQDPEEEVEEEEEEAEEEAEEAEEEEEEAAEEEEAEEAEEEEEEAEEAEEEEEEEEDDDDDDGKSEEGQEKDVPLTPATENKSSPKKTLLADSGSESDNDSDKTSPSPSASDYTVRPVPMLNKSQIQTPSNDPKSSAAEKKRVSQSVANECDSRSKKKIADGRAQEKSQIQKPTSNASKSSAAANNSDSRSKQNQKKIVDGRGQGSDTEKSQIQTPSKAPNSSAATKKRVSRSEANESDSKSKKKQKHGSSSDTEEKKSGSQRLWRGEDENTVMNGLIEFQTQNEVSDSLVGDKFVEAFHEFIKDSLQRSFSKSQLATKLKRLKKKYRLIAEKFENSEDPVSSEDARFFELGKKVWGNEAEKKAKRGGGGSRKAATNGFTEEQTEEMGSESDSEKVMGKWDIQVERADHGRAKNGGAENGHDGWSQFPSLQRGCNLLPECFRVDPKGMMSSVPWAKKNELEMAWSCYFKEEEALQVKLLGLLHEQSMILSEAMQ